MVFSQHIRSIVRLAQKAAPELFSARWLTRMHMLKSKLIAISSALAAFLFSGLAYAEYRLNFQDPVTQTARDIYGLHMIMQN